VGLGGSSRRRGLFAAHHTQAVKQQPHSSGEYSVPSEVITERVSVDWSRYLRQVDQLHNHEKAAERQRSNPLAP